MNQQSPDFLPLLSTLIAGDNRSSTIKLRGDDAKIVLGAIDEVGCPFAVAGEWLDSDLRCTIRQAFRDGRIPSKYERGTRSAMRALAHDSSQVPPRYQVEPGALTVESGVVAGGASSDIQKGRLGNKTVAIKTLKTCREINPGDVQKVRIVSFFHWDVLTTPASDLALLQGVHHLDDLFSSSPLTTHRC